EITVIYNMRTICNRNLFEDIKDGIVLIALLEVLSGQKLPCEQGRKLKRIHGVANIGTALKFLEGRRIKLVNINSTDIADGRPSIVLGLVWTVILYFQIEELTSNLPQLQSLCSSTSSVDSVVSSETASPPSKRKVFTKVQGSAKKALLKWVQYTAARQTGIEVKDFGQSWRSGIAFHSVIHAIRPELVDLEKAKMQSNKKNLEDAFTIAESELGIPRLLDPEDVDVDKPDEKSIMTYVAQFLKHYPDPHNTGSDAQETDVYQPMLRDLKIWTEQFERDLSRTQMMEASLQEKYQSFKHCKAQYEAKRKQVERAIQSLRKDGKLSLDQALVKQAWDKVTSQLFEWHLYLDKSLPAPLGPIAAWLCRAETSLREDISIQQSHEETADTLHRKLEQHKVCMFSDMLKNVDGYKRTFQEIHRAQSINGVPIPLEQLDDMAERFNFVASSSDLHLLKMEFLELKYRLLSLLVLAESKLKSWIIKYGRRDSVELLLQNYMTIIENNKFFEQYEITYQILKKAAEMYANANGSPEEIENITKFMNDTTIQWRNLSVEVRSVRSMLEEVISNWDRYSNTVTILQAWLEDAEKMLNQPEHAKKDFFRHLPQWIQQHTAMNDAGNFLIETCDETVSRDLKQQLLLLNGRWRELFMQVKQYARADELDRVKKEYLDGVAALSAFIDDVKRKIQTHLEVSFLNVKLFVQEMEDIKQKALIMESQYKMITRTAQVVTKEISQEEVNEMLAKMQRIKGQLSKVKETCPVVLFDSQELLPHLEELEKQITHFHESLDKINEITSVLDPEVQPAHVFKQQHQVFLMLILQICFVLDLVAYQENCKKALLLIERNSQIITKILALSKVLNHFSFSVLQKKHCRISSLFSFMKDMVQKTGNWKKNVEVNSRLMKKFEESRTELENVLQTAQCCLKEKGNPEELLRKHTEFFSQLDQRVLNAFLKACDELTDILPEQEQHTLQEAVRKLHKQWKDLQSEAPYHLLRLKIEVEKSKFLATVQECHTELTRQNELMTKESSEKIIREHKMFFGDKGPLQLCEKRQQLIKELCLKLPEWDPVKMTSESGQKDLSELKAQVAKTYMKLIDQPDKWQEYKNRFSELRSWILSKETQLKTIKNGSADTTKYKHFKTSIEEIRQDACKKGEIIIWLKSRLVALSEVSSENEVKKQGDELSMLASDFKKNLALLTEIEKTLGAVGDCVQYTEEVKGTLEELITNSKEAQTEVEKILDVDNLLQAQQIFLYHQQKSKRLHAKRQDVQQQIAHSKELQIEGGLSPAVQEDLWKLESTLESMQQSMEERGDQLQLTINTWEQFERDKETIVKYLSNASSALERILSFSSLESLSSELEKTKELSKQTVAMAMEAENLVRKSLAIQLGQRSKENLQQQAKSIQEQVKKVEATLEEEYVLKYIKTMEMVKNKWDQFVKKFEALSLWINEKEKALDALEIPSSSLDVQINQIKALKNEIANKENEIPKLEEDAQLFSLYLTSGESAHIKAKMTQIRRYWEEFRDHTENLEGTIAGRALVQQRFEENFGKVEHIDFFLAKLMEFDILSCSLAETYKALQDLTDLSQDLEKINQALTSLSSCCRKLTNKEKANQDIVMLQQKHENIMKQVKERHDTLETHLVQCQRLEKEMSTFLTWLEKCETAVRSTEQHVSADKVKLENELQLLQVRFLELEKVDERWKILPQTINRRIIFLQSVLDEHRQYDELLLSFSEWIKQFLCKLQLTSEIDITDQQSAICQNKEHKLEVEGKDKELQGLKSHVEKLCSFTQPEDHSVFQNKVEDCLQLYQEADQVINCRQDVLPHLKAFLELHISASHVLHQLRQKVETMKNIDKSKSEMLKKKLSEVVQDINKLESTAASLDVSLTKAHYHLKHGSSQQRSSSSNMADNVCIELESIQSLLGSKQSEAEALSALCSSILERKEHLLKRIEDLEEKADKEGLKEPNLQEVQQRLRIFNQLDDELNSHQHELKWLMSKAKQIALKDNHFVPTIDKEINCLEATWDDTKKLIQERQEQCCILLDIIRQYHNLKSAVSKAMEVASAVTVAKAMLKDQGDVRRALSKHEAARNELNDRQTELDAFTNKGKHLIAELKKIPNCDAQMIKTEVDSTMDKWLDVSEKIEDNIDKLSVNVTLWEDILAIRDNIEGWCNNAISQSNDIIHNLASCQGTEVFLDEFQSQVKHKEEKLEKMTSNIYELKKMVNSEELPPILLFLDVDLKKKIMHCKTMYNTAKETLKDFNSQKTQLYNFITQMENWFVNTEESLLNCIHSQVPSDLGTVNKIQKEIRQQQNNFDSTQEMLNGLCRKYPSLELETLGGSITSLIKKYEAVNQLSLKTQASLQESLEKHFLQSMEEFQKWYSNLKIAIKEINIATGDSKAIEAKLQKLQKVLDSFNEGKAKLESACQEGENLCTYLPKSSVNSIQEQISKAHQDFEAFLKQCLKDKQALEECIAELESFENQCKSWSLWLHEKEERINTEALGERKQHIPEKKDEVQKVEAFLEELLLARESFDKLSQKAQFLSEKDYSTGMEVRLASQQFSAYQNLIKEVKGKLRLSQIALQDHQTLEEALQDVWTWVKDVQGKLSCAEGTLGDKVTLEKRHFQIQEILLMKGEGEVKLNMAIGKAEQTLKTSNEEGQKVIQSQLQRLKDLWGSIVSTSVSCQSLLEFVINQWNCHLERKSQLDQWLDSTDHKLKEPLEPQNGLKEKFSQLDCFQAIVSEVEERCNDLHHLIVKARELHEKTQDDSFGETAQEELKTQFTNIATVAKEKMKIAEDIVKDHLLYLDAVHEFSDWLHSAKEELHRWSDTSGDLSAIQKKLAKINELINSRQTGEGRLHRIQTLAPAVKKNTSVQGGKDMDIEMQGLQSDWKQWEENAFQSRNRLQDLENQMAWSEQEFAAQAVVLEEALQHFSTLLATWSEGLTPLDSKHTDQELVECWHREKETLDALTKAESINDDIKTQLNDLCRFSKDLSTYSAKVSQLFKEYNSLCIQASKGCQSKEQTLQQRFRAAFRDFQQWLVNSKITTAKCFDVPQNVSDVTANIQKIQEFLSATETGQHKLNLVVSKGELLSSILPKEKVKSIQTKIASAKEDWKKFISTLHQKETTLENLKVQMKDFERSAEPLQDWLNKTKEMVQSSNNNLHDLSTKRREHQNLQSVLEEIKCNEPHLSRLKEKAQQLWEEQSASKNFVHRVSQLSSLYLALSNLTKEKVSRMDRIVAEHQQFSHGLKELQDWMADTIQVLESYCCPTADKNALENRMAKLEVILSLKQEKEIQMKMVVTRGESVLQNTSVEGASVIEQQLKTLKDTWASLLSTCIHLEAIMNASERQYSELREKKSSLSKSKETITKAEGYVHLHQEYQKNLKAFEVWLEKEQEKLNCLSHLEGDIERYEETLHELQELQVHCAEGQALLNATLHAREELIPWGAPQLEERVLESLRQDWTVYQHNLSDVRIQLNTTLSRLKLMENKFLKMDQWLKTLEEKVNIRTSRQSDRATKEIQLQQLKNWHEEITVYKNEVEEVGLLAQHFLEEIHTSSRMGRQATQLASRYQTLVLHVLEQIKFLEEEIRSLEESEIAFSAYRDWSEAILRKFKNVVTKCDVAERALMEKKMQKLEDLMNDMEVGQSLLKSAREKGEKAIKYMEENEAEQLKKQISDHVEQLDEMTCSIRKQCTTLEKCLHLTKEFSDKYKTILSHEPLIKSVVEKGESLFELICDTNVAENIQKLHNEYHELCNMAKIQVASLEEKMKQHEDYNSVLQEVEKWLLQMSSRLITPELMESSDLEVITQQLASHKVYQSLEHELQKHVNHQDTLQQCQAWLSTVCPVLKANPHRPSSSADVVKQVKHFRALQEQANTYLDLLCSIDDLSDSTVKNAATDLQMAKQMIEDRIMNSQYLAQGWEEIKQMKEELWIYFQDSEQQLQNMKRRGAELELNIAHNMVLQVKDFSQQLQSKQTVLTAVTEKMGKLTEGQESPEHKEVGRLSNYWLDLCLQTSNVLLRRKEGFQRTTEYHDCLNVVEVYLENFTQEWDHLARSDAESTATHLEALKKLSVALQDKRLALENLKEQRQKVTEHLNLDDRELVKEQSGHFEQCWIQLEDQVKRKIQLSVTTLQELSAVQAKLQEIMEWAEEQQPSISEALKHSPPPELAQNFLMDHLTLCSEVEAKQLVLKTLIKDADRVNTNLGLNERQTLQKILSDAQNHVDFLSDLVWQRRKKYFKEDLDKACHWLKQCDIVSFPEINLMNSNTELYSQLAKYQQILEQFPEYENLLLIVQKDGQEILPSLNEMDRSYLEEKLSALPQQFNMIIALAKDKFCKVQEAITARKEYASLIELTTRALTEVEDQLVNLRKIPSTLTAKEVVSLIEDYKSVLSEVISLGSAVDELNQKKEGFRSTGQPWLPEEMLTLATLYHKLKRQIEQKLSQLEDMMVAYQEHEEMCKQLEVKLNSIKEKEAEVNEETLPAEEKLKMYHFLAGSLQDSGILLKHIAEHLERLSSQLDTSVHEGADQQVRAWQEMLKVLHTAIGDKVVECENRLVESIDFQTEICRSLDWLGHIKADLNEPLNMDAKLNSIQEEIRTVQIQQEEVQSSLRIMRALSNKEKEKYTKAKELVPVDLENSLTELSELNNEVQEAVQKRQENLIKLYSICQRYYQVSETANNWLEDAQVLLQFAENGLDTENSEENLRNHTEFFNTEKQFQLHLKEVKMLVSDMEPFIQTLRKEDLEQTVRKILKSPMSLVSMVNSFHEAITSLEEKAFILEKTGNIASKATISRSMTTVWQRWTRLRSIAQEQERILEESVQKWNVFNDKMQKATETLDQLHERLPEGSVEKASKNELLDLLDYHSNFILELEQQLSSLGLLKQHSFSLLQDIEITPSSQEQMPIMQEIKAMQDRLEKEINKVKTWIQEGREYLLNPTIESDTQLEKLQTLLNDATIHRQAVEKMAEQQQNKYLGLYTILPSELSLQLAEAGLALVNIHEQIEAKVKEAQQHKTLNQEFNHKIQDVAKELDLIQLKLKEKTNNITQAKRDQKAVSHLDEYNEMLESIIKWIEKAKILLHTNIMWNSATILRNQFMSHQIMFEEAGELPRDLETMHEKTEYLASVYFTEEMSQQVSDLHRQIEDLHQAIKQRLQNIQDAAKDMKKFETEVKALRIALEQTQATLTSPEIGRLSLKEQLSHRQHLLLEMESLKPKVHAVQACQSALRIPEEVLATLPICHAALRLQEDASHLQHTAIQQCNIMQEAVVQYEQYEQEMKHLQQMIEKAHHEIQEKPISTSNIQELETQISCHEELAEKIKSYQEQIASLNSKCKMLTMKAKHATMLLTVTEVEGLSERMEELDSEDMLPAHSAHPSVVMMTAGRCHTLLSPVTEESGEEGSNSEISSPPACRSPSPVANADASVNQDIAYYQALSAEQLQAEAPQIQPSAPIAQESYEPRLEAVSSTKLDDLQRSWETLKNVISEKQRTLYEALERQQKYQDSLQSISTKMEAIEVKLNDTLDNNNSPESQMAGHQALMDEILMLQEEISEIQTSLAEELVSEPLEADGAEQLALQSTLTVLAERMATIKMKASGKQQLLEEKLNEQLEEQRQEKALQRYRSEADELDHWLLNTQASLNTTLVTDEEPMDMDSQLVDCQNMLVEIEQKVVTLSELSVHNENLLMEGKAQTKDEAEQLALKLRTLKGSLLELQRILHDKQINIQGAVQEKEECKSDLVTSQDPSVQEWLAQAQTTRSQQQLSIIQRQKELEKELEEQKSLLRSVASHGEEILNQSFSDIKKPDKLTEELSLEGEKPSNKDQMKMKWESLNQEFCIKHRLLQNVLEQEQEQSVYSRSNPLMSGVPLHKEEGNAQDKASVKSLLVGLNEAFKSVPSQTRGAEKENLQFEQKLYRGVSATSSWLDGVEEHLLVSTALLPEVTETCLDNQESLAKDIKEMTEKMDKSKDLFSHVFPESADNRDVIGDTLDSLLQRLTLLDILVNQRCQHMKERLQQILNFQVNIFCQPCQENCRDVSKQSSGVKNWLKGAGTFKCGFLQIKILTIVHEDG
uniref:Spectrin repeat containing nuclear envelope protein 1 n=1 Tax=Laticauda laticaudata TaxID=8630 RepID=A0A8C5RH19_LATLA